MTCNRSGARLCWIREDLQGFWQEHKSRTRSLIGSLNEANNARILKNNNNSYFTSLFNTNERRGTKQMQLKQETPNLGFKISLVDN